MILVTGGAGFIGANLVEALTGRGQVTVCDWFGQDEKWKNLRHCAVDRFIFPEELTDFLDETVGDLEAVVHMGAVSATTERDVDLIVRSNVQLSHSLWRFCARRGIPFIYASSAATYGDGGMGFDDRSDPDYLARLRPLNAYGWSKLAFDRLILNSVARGEPTPPRWAGLKFFNVYGPREQHKGPMRSVMTSNFERLRGGGALGLFKSDRAEYGDGGQQRDFVYVGDCVSVIEWMLDHSFPSDLYNVGTGKAQSWLDAGKAMFAALDQAPRIEFVDMPANLVGRYQYFTEANITKLGGIGAPVPVTNLREGVHRTYQYMATESQ